MVKSDTALKTRFIVNPRSNRAVRCLPAVRRFAAERGAAVVVTERARHASELAADALAEGCELIVAVGGDGTMNEVATALVGTEATLGLVPCGSGNGLARHLGLHGSPAHAFGILRTGRPRPIDSGLADGHPFFNAAGIGFEAEIAHRFNLLTQRGFFRYLTTSAKALRAWVPQDYTLVHDGSREQCRTFTLAVANSDQYGNNARIAPGARIDDGQIDLCAVPPVNWGNAGPLLARLFTGHLGQARNVTLRRAPHFVVERAHPGLLHTDGEVHQADTRIEFRVRPLSLRIMCPAAPDGKN